jgi:hypothetical protein
MNEADRTNEVAIGRAARSAFERSVAELDTQTRARLTRARHEALRQLAEPRVRSAAKYSAALPRSPGWALEALRPTAHGWAAAAVAVALGLGIAWLLPNGAAPTSERGAQLASSPDVELLLGGDELDMLEDLEFYSWLGEQGDPPDANADGIG